MRFTNSVYQPCINIEDRKGDKTRDEDKEEEEELNQEKADDKYSIVYITWYSDFIHSYFLFVNIFSTFFHIYESTSKILSTTELKDDRMENYGAFIGFISKQHCRIAK